MNFGAPAAAGHLRPLPLRRSRLHNPVLLVLMLATLGASLGLAFVVVAPNRLLSGAGVPLLALTVAVPVGLWLAAGALLMAAFLPPARWMQAVVAVLAGGLMCGCVWLAGQEAAARLAAAQTPLTRISLGGGFWMLLMLSWLAAADALLRAGTPPWTRVVAHLLLVLPPALLFAMGALDALSLVLEYRQREEAFNAAAARHLSLVAWALAFGLALGLPAGVLAARQPRLQSTLLGALNLIQTVPSLALLALLIAPLGALAALLPGWGIQGIGVVPAVVALTLYALLPVVHSTVSGLQQVPAAALQAGVGMGMTTRQLFWQVQLPLALPVWLAGLRTTTVQLIGLAVVAALIGAGGFGALVFQGLTSSALDLVMLGVLPVVALALVVDGVLTLLIDTLPGAARP